MIPLFIRPFIPYIAAALLCVIIYSIGHIKGTSSCEIKNAKTETAAVQKGVEDHGKIEAKIMSLSDADLDGRISIWMRD